MSHRHLLALLFGVGATGAAFGPLPGCGAQPEVKCTATSGPAAVRYTVVSKTEAAPGDCDVLPKTGELLGIQTYVPPVNDPNAYNTPNSIAIQSERIAVLRENGEAVTPPVVDPDASHQLYALGAFDQAFPDSNNVCHISKMSAGELNLGVVPEHMVMDDEGKPVVVPEQPAVHVKYEWTNVRIIVSADSIGTQTFGDLTYTEGGCTAQLKVGILTPRVDCTQPPPNDSMLDPRACESAADPSRTFGGSGIGSGIPVTCDPEQKLCLPDKTAP